MRTIADIENTTLLDGGDDAPSGSASGSAGRVWCEFAWGVCPRGKFGPFGVYCAVTGMCGFLDVPSPS